ncbi:MAG: deoxyguanosinetriphosphate triphosphohydrolase [Bacteroidetes bacterium]|nr:deoxyguanosinetriphosphate triphosphohydrolase [Bacteroidota bacterium]
MNWEKLLSTARIRKSNMNSKDIRNEFESDFGRIIFSPALRRMHDKTQVFPLTTDDNIHSRLTHSNEVMSIGYTFGLKLCASEKIQRRTNKSEQELCRILPVILKNICLIHDIGNAPFGHFGETIISNYFQEVDKRQEIFFKDLEEHQKRDFFNYDGNAQGLRVLTKLQILNDRYGLNLTFATLGSYLKYPNQSEINKKRKELSDEQKKKLPIESAKHGVFYSESDFFDLIINECGLKVGEKILRHPLCYLMEAADSIAYLIMDMEDGFNKKLFPIKYIQSLFEKKDDAISKSIVDICSNKILEDNSKIVSIRISLIDYFVDLAFNVFINKLEEIEAGEFSAELIEQDNLKIYTILKEISGNIFQSREINYLETTGYAVFKGLLDYYTKFLFHENEDFTRRAKSLISKSVIDCAIEDSLSDICKNYKPDIKKGDQELDPSKVAQFKKLNEDQINKPLSREEKDELLTLRNYILSTTKPQFEDLSNYYKLRVIIDFISGMTDQFALNHFQKISGQKI